GRVPGGAPGPHEIRSDHRLPMSGRERVERTPAEGGEEEEDEQAVAGERPLEDTGEAVPAPVRGCLRRSALAAGSGERAVSGSNVERGVALVARALDGGGWVGPEPVRRVAGLRGGSHGGSGARPGHDRLPPHATGKGPVVDDDPPGARRASRRQRKLDAGEPEAALPRRERDRGAGESAQRQAAPAGRDRQVAEDLLAVAGEDRA